MLSAAALLALAGCASDVVDVAPEAARPAASAPAAAGPVDARVDALVGRWGIASYRDEKDRARVEAQARAQCRNAYVINRGPTDGVMIHFADDPKMYELKLKSGGGKTYLGFEAPPGDWQDREVLELSARRMILRFVDPEINGRYGTFIYVRC